MHQSVPALPAHAAGPCPRRRDCFVSRLWSRFGARSLAIGLLVLSLVGGYCLCTNRETQRHDAAVTAARQTELNDLRQFKVDVGMQQWADAPQRAAQADAQAKAGSAAQAAADQARAVDEAAKRASRGGARTGPTTPPVPIPTSCAAYSGNKAIACALLPEWGFGIDQMACLIPMWTKESGWNERSRNPSSGSYGIPQALPATKMAAYGADYLTNPTPQIKWGLAYIKGRYETPCKAWTFWQAHNWY